MLFVSDHDVNCTTGSIIDIFFLPNKNICLTALSGLNNAQNNGKIQGIQRRRIAALHTLRPLNKCRFQIH